MYRDETYIVKQKLPVFILFQYAPTASTSLFLSHKGGVYEVGRHRTSQVLSNIYWFFVYFLP